MFARIFSFRGRINRLQYFLGGVALSLAQFTVLAAMMAAGGMGRPGAQPAAMIPMLLLALPLLAAGIWISLSLMARRLRDIGWEPAIVIPAWFGVGLIILVTASGAGSASIGAGLGGLLLGGMLNFVFGIALLFWPGRPDNGGVFDEDHQARLIAEVKARATPPIPASPGAPTRDRAPARVAQIKTTPAPPPRIGGGAPAGGGFGRRGL